MAGRPKKDEKEVKSKQIRVRLTEEEHEKLKIISETTGINASDLLRSALDKFYAVRF